MMRERYNKKERETDEWQKEKGKEGNYENKDEGACKRVIFSQSGTETQSKNKRSGIKYLSETSDARSG